MNQQPKLTAQQPPSLLRTILLAGLLAGTLDITSATVYYLINGGKEPVRILYYIASAILGPTARTQGTPAIAALGLFLHYVIAFSWTILFFLIYPKIKIMAMNKFITAIIYGLVVWTVMNLAVVPLSSIGKFPSNTKNAIINAVILMIAIGLPVSLIAHSFYSKKNLYQFGS